MNAKKIGFGLLDAIVKIFFVIIVVMLIVRYSRVAYNYGYHIFNQTAVSSGTGRTVTVTVESGDSAGDIADKLSGVGLITDKTLFRLQEQFSEYHGMEKAGTYELSTTMTPDEMLSIMAGGVKSGTVSVSDETEETEETEGAEAESSEETGSD